MKIIFMDIDGTMVAKGHSQPSHAVMHAVRQLQTKGIAVFAATGRPPYLVPDWGLDGIIGFSGGMILSRSGKVLYSRPIDKEDVLKATDNALSMKAPIQWAGARSLFASSYSPELEAYMQTAGLHCAPDQNFFKRLDEDIYEGMCAIPKPQWPKLLEGTKHLALANWQDEATDLISADTDKGKAAAYLLKTLSIPVSQSMAIGDGDNDIALLKACGKGYAMADGSEAVKKAARHLCPSADEDGVVTLLSRLGLL
jgi:hypothetical protein